jgi:acyl carrier protein
MTTVGIEDRVQAVLVRTLRLPPETLQGARMGNPAAWDSLGHMSLVAELEREFGVRFPTYSIPSLVTVPAIVEAVGTHGGR